MTDDCEVGQRAPKTIATGKYVPGQAQLAHKGDNTFFGLIYDKFSLNTTSLCCERPDYLPFN